MLPLLGVDGSFSNFFIMFVNYMMTSCIVCLSFFSIFHIFDNRCQILGENMCGIIGCVSGTWGKKGEQVGAKVIAGLERIQYRGYDSFGFAYVGNGNHGETQLES